MKQKLNNNNNNNDNNIYTCNWRRNTAMPPHGPLTVNYVLSYAESRLLYCIVLYSSIYIAPLNSHRQAEVPIITKIFYINSAAFCKRKRSMLCICLLTP